MLTIGTMQCEQLPNMVTKNETMSLVVKGVIIIFVLSGLALATKKRQQPGVVASLPRHQVAGPTFSWLPPITKPSTDPPKPKASLFSTNFDFG